MATKWKKNLLLELKTLVERLNFTGTWKKGNDKQDIFITNSGQRLNYWPSNGTVTFQGKDTSTFEIEYEAALIRGSESNLYSQNNRVFLVYGHDVEARRDVELFLLRLKLNPYVMKNDATASNVIIEVLEKKINEHSFGIVLLTPDDFGYAKQLGNISQTDNNKQSRARQNVILELGMLLGKLGRSKVAILVKGDVEKPSDINGVLYINYNKGIKENGNHLISILRESGININEEDILAAMSD